jgi:sulfate-transporting ATPase
VSQLAQFVVLGLGSGALYALSGQGLVLIYRGSGVVNFAQGAVGMAGAFVFYWLTGHGWPEAPAMISGVAVSVLIGVLIQLALMRRLANSAPLVRLVATLGALSLLMATAAEIWGNNSKNVKSPLPSSAHRILGVVFTEDRVWLLAIAIAMTALLSYLSNRTRLGRATEAVAENPVAASSLGLSPDAIAAITWAAGSALAAIAAIFVAPILLLSVTALSFTVLRGLAAALVGGFRSFWGTLLGALLIGVIESTLGLYVPTQPGLSDSAAFGVIVLVLVFRGRSLPVRGDVLDRLPRVGGGQVRIQSVAPALVIAAAALLTLPAGWTQALSVSVIFGIICLSIVLLTGYVGQLSLAQFALAGLGAWAAARFSAVTGAPFLLSVLVGVACTAPAGLLIGLPALRTRGVNLAVITFGLSTMIYELILSNSSLTGGLLGTTVKPQSIAGISIDSTEFPERYGIVCLVALAVVAVAVANLRRGRTGRRMLAVRSNERAAASLGISVYGVKSYAFTLASAVAALGGVLFTMQTQQIVFAGYDATTSIQVIVFAVLGGVGYVSGAFAAGTMAFGGIGAYALDQIGISQGWFNVIAGAGLLLMILHNPDGIAHKQAQQAEWVRRWLGRRRPGAPSSPPLPVAEPARVTPRRLEVDGLTVRFGAVLAVHDVSLTVDPGEVVGLIGPNGAGKTTFIDALTGYVRPSAGTVVLGGRSIGSLPAGQRSAAGLGRSFQTLELFEDMTVAENIQAACDDHSWRRYVTDMIRPGKQQLSSAAASAVREFGLADELGRKPTDLPQGHRRLVAIARAVASQPSVILLDEPAAGLSPVETAELGRLIRRLARQWGMGVLIIEHDVGLVMDICDRVVALEFGELLCEGAPADVAADRRLVAAYLGEPHEFGDPAVASGEG